jgi:hypothetical protein
VAGRDAQLLRRIGVGRHGRHGPRRYRRPRLRAGDAADRAPAASFADGQTKKFPVVVVELRGITPRQALAGPISTSLALDPTGSRAVAAIEAPRPDYVAEAEAALGSDDVRDVWRTAKAAGHMNDDLSKQLFAIAGRKDAEGKADTEPGPDADGVYPGRGSRGRRAVVWLAGGRCSRSGGPLMSWHTGRLAGFDLETTGIDVEQDRIVTACVVQCGGGHDTASGTWLADPGIDIPEEAAKVHGITTAQARAEGHPAAEVVEQVVAALAEVVLAGPRSSR